MKLFYLGMPSINVEDFFVFYIVTKTEVKIWNEKFSYFKGDKVKNNIKLCSKRIFIDVSIRYWVKKNSFFIASIRIALSLILRSEKSSCSRFLMREYRSQHDQRVVVRV